MPRIPFQKPKKIEWEDLTDRYGRLVAEPFEKGYALTVGNSLRRTLLAIIPGAAVAWVKIQGVKDPLTRVPGVKEETVDVLLNVKKLAVHVPSGEPTVARVEAKGPKEVTGADVAQGGVEVLNPDLHLATLEPGAWASQRHWHEKEDELVYVLSGELVLVEDDGEVTLKPGDCAAWKAGVRNGHHLINRSSSNEARFLVVGTRDSGDWGEYPDIDLRFNPARYDRAGGAGGAYSHKDGRPY